MSLLDAKREMFAILADEDGTPCDELAALDVNTVHWNEPGPSQVAGPIAITVSTLGIGVKSPDFDRVIVRIYVKPNADVLAAQDILDAVVEAVERKIETTSSLFARSDWSADYNQPYDVLIASSTLAMERTD